jgi:peptide/nickel transport system substrate-binding protein
MNSKIAFLLGTVVVVFAMACTKEVVKEVPVDRVITQEVIKEVPVEKIVEVEKTVIKTIEVEKPVTVIKEVVKEVEVPGKTVVVETVKEVVKTVEVPGQTVVVEKEVIKTVEVEVIKTVEVEADLPPALAAEAARYGGDLKIVSSGGIASLDSDFSGAYTSAACCMHIHESLFKYDEDFVSRPELTKTWSLSPDGKTYTFEILQHDFHNTSAFNGRPVVADDVMESIQRWVKRHSGGSSLKQFGYADGDVVIDKLNDYTIRLPLTNAYSPFVSHLGQIRSALQIWPKEIAALDPFQDVGEDNIVGSGPYKLASWEPGFRVILERHESYVPRNEPHSNFAGAQVPYMDRLIFLEVPDAETKVAGLKTGEWDIIDSAPPDAIDALQDDPNINVALNIPGSMSNIAFNGASKVLEDVKIRQAIQAAIDAEDMLTSLGPKNTWSLCSAYFHCETPLARTTGDELYNQADMARAKQLLAESSYNDEEIIMLSPTDLGALTPLGLVLKPLLEELGLNIKAPTLDWSTEIGILFGGEEFWDQWDIVPMGFGFYGLHDPITDGFAKGGSFINYHNDNLKALRAQWVATLDPEEKDQIVDDMQLEFYNDPPFVILGMYHAIHPYRTYVKGFQSIRAMPHHTNVWIEK